MKSISLEELKDKHLGKVGTAKRDNYEYELEMEIILEQFLVGYDEEDNIYNTLKQLAIPSPREFKKYEND